MSAVHVRADTAREQQPGRRGRRRSVEGGDSSHRKGRRWSSPLWARLCLVIGLLLVFGSGASLVGGELLIARYAGAVDQQHLLGAAAATAKSIDGPINLLLVGIDERPNDSADGARADSIIIMHVPATHDHAYLVSIPRDTRVQIPAYAPTGYKGGADKINAAFQFGFAK